MKKREVKKYAVSFNYTQYGTATIEAASAQEARKNIESLLDQEGLEGLDYEPDNREFDAVMARVV